MDDGQGALALAQVGAGGLAGLVGLGLDVDEVVGELEGDAEALAELAHDVDRRVVAAGEHRAVAGRGGDEHAGLVGEHPEVVVDRVGAGRARPVVADLARAQPHEGLGLDLDGLRPEVGDDVGGRAEEQVTDEDGGGVAVGGVRAGRPAAHVGLVHDVVVVERGQVGELDPGGRRDDAVVDAVAQLGRQQREQRPEPLAARGGEVRVRLGQEGVLGVDPLRDERVDGGEPLGELRAQPLRGTGQLEHRGGAPLRRFRRHRRHSRNCEALLAISRRNPGTMPSTTVAATPKVIATVEPIDGVSTTTSSPVGSVKYMSTMRRT